ncbi:hypothetical protein A3A46_01995 [Candidatus Roizmanbacteria bacterium RIFCSPLOWO2_01_FULL_37_13]|uniref:Uncharacterized protein n=1 Tax=Candidatus Roizmanbacteria bacterium RIFCSPHIGHO2_02_FULL_38_11 TaxID=1802039 RepID=A0A1F7GY36_9BACT|nr:MAG: hypothetical protein A3C25_01030 [Candidatus Roizmanbacteria bacterium RIFCSPHIGHO2_02_FULL_38_11]OGK42856.1 MAG: hypothetical protein A3A46_01995 [Candidatus Roizmanbacteria bacterium RIFCSPLOWO2_01_FULL_37_13]
MKKFLLIVNTTVLILILSFIILPPPVTAQNPPQTTYSNPLFFLQELLKIFFSFNPASQPPLPISPNPSGPPPQTTSEPFPTIPAGKLGDILTNTIAISEKLEGEDIIWPPSWYFNRLTDPPSNGSYTAFYSPATSTSNLYWCTYLVINAYNLAGLTGLTRAHLATKNMQQFFMTTSGYNYIPYSVKFIDYFANPPTYQLASAGERQQALNTVKPGCATFFQYTPGVHVTNKNHTAVLKTVNLDSSYNGYIETYDANSTRKISRYPVYSGNIQGTPFTNDSLRGFGCPSL